MTDHSLMLAVLALGLAASSALRAGEFAVVVQDQAGVDL